MTARIDEISWAHQQSLAGVGRSRGGTGRTLCVIRNPGLRYGFFSRRPRSKRAVSPLWIDMETLTMEMYGLQRISRALLYSEKKKHSTHTNRHTHTLTHTHTHTQTHTHTHTHTHTQVLKWKFFWNVDEIKGIILLLQNNGTLANV